MTKFPQSFQANFPAATEVSYSGGGEFPRSKQETLAREPQKSARFRVSSGGNSAGKFPHQETLGFQKVSSAVSTCRACGAVANVLWAKCLGCGQALSDHPVGEGASNENQNWHDLYSERAAIAEHDGGLYRAAAERQAWECVVSHWLNSNPPRTSSDKQCAHCANQLGDFDCIPIAKADGGATWLHAACHGPWMAVRLRQAETALGGMGIEAPE